MPDITFTLSHTLNQAIQPGTTDVAYYADIQDYTLANGSTVSNASEFVELGPIIAIDYPNKQITCSLETTTILPAVNDYIFFSKDNRANMTSLLGYYAEVEVINNSTEKVELYTVGTEMFESSK